MDGNDPRNDECPHEIVEVLRFDGIDFNCFEATGKCQSCGCPMKVIHKGAIKDFDAWSAEWEVGRVEA